MIKSKDWIVFLKHNVPLSELPISPEHLPFCEQWLRRHSQKLTTKEGKPPIEDLVNKLESYGSYPPRRYSREEVRLDYGIHHYVGTKDKK